MKIFCSHAWTGEDVQRMTSLMTLATQSLEANGHQVFCSVFDDEITQLNRAGDMKGVFARAFKELKESDALVVIIASPRRSVGQIMEFGLGFGENKPIYLFEHQSATGSSYLPELSSKSYVWATADELISQLREI